MDTHDASQADLERVRLLVSEERSPVTVPHEGSVANGPSQDISLLLRIGPGLLLCTFLVAFDLSYLLTNYIGSIASDFHQLENAVWIILPSLVSQSSFQPLYAHLATQHGRRPVILAGSFILTLSLLLCGLCRHLWELSLSRVLVGVGTSGLSLLITILLSDLVPLTHLAIWRSTLTITEALGAMTGGPVGTMVLSATDWRIPFLLESVLAALAFALLYWTLEPRSGCKSASSEGEPQAEPSTQTFDTFGLLAMVSSVTTPLLAINMGGSVLPWGHPLLTCMFISIPFQVAGFIYVEIHIAKNPIVPLQFFKSFSSLYVILCSVPTSFAWNQVFLNLAFYTQVRDVEGNSHEMVLACLNIGLPLGSLLSGWIIVQTQEVKLLLIANVLLTLCLFFSLAMGWIKPELLAFMPVLTLFGFVTGVSQNCFITAIFGSVRKEEQASFYAIFDLIQAFSSDTAITLSSTMTRTLAQKYLSAALGDSNKAIEISRKSMESLEYIRSLPAATRKIVLDVFIRSIQQTYALSCIIILLSLMAVPWIRTTVHKATPEEDGHERQNDETRDD